MGKTNAKESKESAMRRLRDAGYNASIYNGRLIVPVTDSGYGSSAALGEIRKIVEALGLTAEWTGEGNTGADGDTTSDIEVCA